MLIVNHLIIDPQFGAVITAKRNFYDTIIRALNLHIGIIADILEARVRGTIMTYSGDSMYELMADLSFTPLPFIDIHGGYKTFVVDVEEEDALLDYDMSGPYAAITISF